MAEEKEKKKTYLVSVFQCKCPRCRQGNLFLSGNPYAFRKNRFMQMTDHCQVCGQPTELEVGFYYGTSYVSYALTVAFSVATAIAWALLVGFSIYDNRIFWWLGLNTLLLIVLQPPLMRLSRSLWLSWFVKYDPDWAAKQAEAPERVIKEHMHGW